MSLTDSKFNMWRATVYLVVVDGKITNEEKKWLQDFTFKAPFNEEQRKIIQNDLKKFDANFPDIYEKITHAPDRATLVHFANIIFKKDKDFAKKEELFLKTLNSSVLKKVDMVKALEELTNSNDNDEKIELGILQSAYDFLDKFNKGK